MSDSIQKSKFVALTYTITDDTDEILERIDVPITYIQGMSSDVIEKIEIALEGHKEGDDVSVDISPEEGFGPYQSELTFKDDIENVPPEFQKIGAEVEFQDNQNEVKKFRVIKIENGKLTVDGNHPFAGKTIKYNIKVREVRDATHEELTNGIELSPQLH